MNKTSPRVVAVVQARMTSTRLPGKVLRPLAGKPLLWHIIHRLKRAHTVDAIAVATSTRPEDDAVESFCREEGVVCVRGSELNVLARFAKAAEIMRAAIIVRVTGDAPFVDPDFVDYAVRGLIDGGGGYACIQDGVLCAHEGIDPLTRGALDQLVAQAADDPVAREHVTGYFRIHPDFVLVNRLPAYKPLAHENVRISVDTPDDLAFAEAVYRRLGTAPGEASLPEVLKLVERTPELRAINAGVRQKPIGHTGGTALLCCEGGGTRGYGHIRRCMMLAHALRDREGWGVLLALNGDANAAALMRDSGFETHVVSAENPKAALDALVAAHAPGLLVLDLRHDFTQADVASLASRVGTVAVIDDGSDRRLAATHAYYPPVPQAKNLTWAGSRCAVRIGWEWSVLGMEPRPFTRAPDRADHAPLRLVVSMGGSDPMDYSRVALKALARIGLPLQARFVLGPGYGDPAALAEEITALGYAAVLDSGDLRAEFAAADLALVTFGVTAFEMATLGVPSVYLALTDDHALAASAFVAAGMGQLVSADPDAIAATVADLGRDREVRQAMAKAGRALIDGKGAERIAAELVKADTASSPVRA